MTDLWQTIRESKKPIYLYGTGNGADLVIDKMSSVGVTPCGIFASDGFVRGQSFRGFTVKSYSEVKSSEKDFIIVVAFGSSLPEVRENVMRMAEEHELYIADAPVYGNTFFDKDYVSVNKRNLKLIYDSLADSRSREVFENVVKFKTSGKINHLFASEDNEENTLLEIFKLKENATIFDLGAFIGDTAEKFASLWPDYGKIVAVEPSVKNFSRLKSTAEKIRNTVCVNAAISYLNGSIFFDNEGGRNQAAHSGNTVTESITIDTLSHRFGAPDFIKFDIEGEELNGIIGGEETIKKYKPALLVSAYHRSEDIVNIPTKILSLRNDYKMYVRHFPCIPCWDTYYLFI